MGQLQIPGTSVQYSNPKQIDQNSNLFPDCGDLAFPQVAQVNPQTGLPVGPSTRTGKAWQAHPVPTGTNATWGRPLIFAAPACPQPGSFDPTPATAPPIAVNQDPVAPGKGKPITVSGSTGSTGNPDNDLKRQVTGQVPNGPAFSNPS